MVITDVLESVGNRLDEVFLADRGHEARGRANRRISGRECYRKSMGRVPRPTQKAAGTKAGGIPSRPEPVSGDRVDLVTVMRSEEHTSELQSLMRISYAVFCLKKKNTIITTKV